MHARHSRLIVPYHVISLEVDVSPYQTVGDCLLKDKWRHHMIHIHHEMKAFNMVYLFFSTSAATYELHAHVLLAPQAT